MPLYTVHACLPCISAALMRIRVAAAAAAVFKWSSMMPLRLADETSRVVGAHRPPQPDTLIGTGNEF